jgi:hypothetical protein
MNELRVYVWMYVYVYECMNVFMYKVVQIWPGWFVCKQVTVCPGHIWTTLYVYMNELMNERVYVCMYVYHAHT